MKRITKSTPKKKAKLIRAWLDNKAETKMLEDRRRVMDGMMVASVMDEMPIDEQIKRYRASGQLSVLIANKYSASIAMLQEFGRVYASDALPLYLPDPSEAEPKLIEYRYNAQDKRKNVYVGCTVSYNEHTARRNVMHLHKLKSADIDMCDIMVMKIDNTPDWTNYLS